MARSEFSEEKTEELLSSAEDQLMKYAADEGIIKRSSGTALKSIALVFSGWELKAAEEMTFSRSQSLQCSLQAGCPPVLTV